MRGSVLLSLLICCSLGLFAQAKIDSALYKKLNEMFINDQKWRKESEKLYKNIKSDYDQATVDKNWALTDSTNEAEAKQIITRYGYPGYSLVGESGSSKFWAIVQHCDDHVAFQQQVLKLMHKEVIRKNADGENYAYLQDRVLTNLGKNQLYGTQGRTDPKTKKWAPLPITDPSHVEARRKAVGMISLKQYLKDINGNN